MDKIKKANGTHVKRSAYDDGNIPEIDWPQDKNGENTAPKLDENTRPRQDGPGGA